jgi:hypothetical protein
MVSLFLPLILQLHESGALKICLGSLPSPWLLKYLSEAHTNLRTVRRAVRMQQHASNLDFIEEAFSW